jgi:uncharacterized protein involved in exopolysaccharide biosynthesis
LLLGLGTGIALVLWKPPTFVSTARMWETVKLRLPEGGLFVEDVQNSLGTQTELLQSSALRDLALARLKASGTNVAVPVGEDGEPLPVSVRVAGSAKSSVFVLEATSSQAAYTQNYLDALMNVYLEYKRNIRRVVSGDTLASITAQVQRQEQMLKEEQDALMAFERTNYIAILQQEGAIAGSYLATLKTKLSELELEDRLLKATALDQSTAASRQAIQLKMEHIQNSIKEWESKILQISSRLAEAERLKLHVQREQTLYDRLMVLVQNVGISRNIDQETIAVLEPASPPKRSCTQEIRLLGMAGFGGLGLGLGIIVLMALYRARRCNPPKPKPQPGQEAIKPSAAERLEQIKELQEKGLLSKEAYDRKAEQIVDSL